MYAETRADDLVIRASGSCCGATRSCRRSGSTRSPIAATTQIGDQGLTIGRTAALLAGLPKTVPGYAIDRMCAGAMTAVTTTAGGIAFGAYDVAIAGGVEHMGRHPMGEGVDPNPRILAEKLVDPSALVMGSTAENLHDRLPQITKERADAFGLASARRRPPRRTRTARSSPTWCRSRSAAPSRLGPGDRPTSRRARAPRWRSWPR
jgi:acetyl-CoA acyltransferase